MNGKTALRPRAFVLGIIAGVSLGFTLFFTGTFASAHNGLIFQEWQQAPEIVIGDLQWQLDANDWRWNKTKTDITHARNQWVNEPSSTLWLVNNHQRTTHSGAANCNTVAAGLVVITTHNYATSGLLGLESRCAPGGTITSSHIAMDWRDWHTGYTYPPSNKFDFRSILTHELGHSIGANHESGTGPECTGLQPTRSTMCPGLSPISVEKGLSWRRSISDHDISAVEFNYQNG